MNDSKTQNLVIRRDKSGNTVIRKNKSTNVLIRKSSKTLNKPKDIKKVKKKPKNVKKTAKSSPKTVESLVKKSSKTPKTVNSMIKKSSKITIKLMDHEDLPEIDNSELLPHCLDVGDDNNKMSQDELIEKVRYQKQILIKNRSEYSEQEYLSKLKTISETLSKLTVEMSDDKFNKMKANMITAGKIFIKKIPKKQFIEKIKLDRPDDQRDNKDPNDIVFTTSRKYFKGLNYMKAPKHIKFPPKRGNKSMPADVLKKLNFI